MALGRATVLLISLLLFTKFITYSWQNSNLGSYSPSQLKRDVTIEDKCDNIYQYDDQCSYVIEHCQDTTPGLINYIQLYYCSSATGKPVIFLILCFWLLLLFGFVGIAASDFFCPNLQTIASALRLSESLTGVTFLAFGNGSPDLFSTFSAMNSNLGSLALGELIGAAFFIVSVVAGSMCAIKPFRAKRHSFLRDVSFFTLAIVMVLVIVSDGLIYMYEAVILVVFYVLYVTVVIGGNYYMKRRSNYLNLMQRARLEYEENGSDIDHLLLGSDLHTDEMELYDEGFETEGYRDISGSGNAPQHIKLRIRTSLFSAIEFQDVVKSLQRTTNTGYGFVRLQRRQRRRGNDSQFNNSSNVPLTSRMEEDDINLATTSLDNTNTFEPTATNTHQHGDERRLRALWHGLRTKLSYRWNTNMDDLSFHLFPSLANFEEKSIFNKISSVVSAPMILLLVVTLPVVKGYGQHQHQQGDGVALDDSTLTLLENVPDNDDADDNYNNGDDPNGMTATPIDSISSSTAQWCRWLTALQLVGASTLFGSVVAMNNTTSRAATIISLVMAGFGCLLSMLFLWTTSSHQRPRLYWMMCFVGFGMAVIWIYIIANEVVSVLQTIGMVLGVSEAILGLTVFAVGNSLGDFVANVTMARMGYPLMAMSACFGGPMLNILLGIGIGATYVTGQRQEPYPITVSSTIIVSSIGLLVVLISALVLVPLNGYRMSRLFGYSWMGIYLIIMIINLIVEFST
ncbi:Sodium/calcium exchanger protein-domain-containing protein [Absidia repens]|uniref:Sodium/calcium exchanger protein-domain-containing protein n=1 Tax=Absidia repens TaxID=90262 RepID=A0A1X2IJA1_9FUNG|nr:Sodium/calcium exchanger protein-domain-containing protein [Absidia repens]